MLICPGSNPESFMNSIPTLLNTAKQISVGFSFYDWRVILVGMRFDLGTSASGVDLCLSNGMHVTTLHTHSQLKWGAKECLELMHQSAALALRARIWMKQKKGLRRGVWRVRQYPIFGSYKFRKFQSDAYWYPRVEQKRRVLLQSNDGMNNAYWVPVI